MTNLSHVQPLAPMCRDISDDDDKRNCTHTHYKCAAV